MCMFEQRILETVADKASEVNAYSVFPRKTVLRSVRKRMKQLPADYRDKAAYGMENGRVSRRDFLKLLGVGAAGGIVSVEAVKFLRKMDHESVAGYAAGSDGSYETITVPSGQLETVVVRDETYADVLFDITSQGSAVKMPLRGDATIKNVGVRGTQQQGEYIAGAGGRASNITIDKLYADYYGGDRHSVPVNLTKNFSGHAEIKGLSVHGSANNGLYASSSPGTLRCRDSYCTNSTVAQFRGGIGDHKFINCTAVINEKSHDALPYPNGGEGKRGFSSRDHGEPVSIEVVDSEVVITPDHHEARGAFAARQPNSTITASNCCANVPDGHLTSGKGTVNGDIEEGCADQQPPEYAPTSPEGAASGEGASKVATNSQAGSSTGKDSPC